MRRVWAQGLQVGEGEREGVGTEPQGQGRERVQAWSPAPWLSGPQEHRPLMSGASVFVGVNHREGPRARVRSEETKNTREVREGALRPAKGCVDGSWVCRNQGPTTTGCQLTPRSSWEPCLAGKPSSATGEEPQQWPASERGQNQHLGSYLLDSVYEGKSHEGNKHRQWD